MDDPVEMNADENDKMMEEKPEEKMEPEKEEPKKDDPPMEEKMAFGFN